ncbi:hypothetical protein [Polaromonas sp.]|uniref:hypothetical protein n=1 Tax=Polaromonas sp. TaxID=1869339 RepID=UPI0013BB2E31|nr:hypothetical protein [Polaromonas sp.]NDP63004.1 hypothetical protein [Polaromonas sp.]
MSIEVMEKPLSVEVGKKRDAAQITAQAAILPDAALPCLSLAGVQRCDKLLQASTISGIVGNNRHHGFFGGATFAP